MQTTPSFSSLQYQDAGNYICETTLQEVEGLKKRKTLLLTVEGNGVDDYDCGLFSSELCYWYG